MLLTTCPNSTRSRRRMPPSRRASRWQNARPAKRVAGQKTAPRKIFSRPSILRPANATQTLGTHQANYLWAYDFASGCAVAPNSVTSGWPTVTAEGFIKDKYIVGGSWGPFMGDNRSSTTSPAGITNSRYTITASDGEVSALQNKTHLPFGIGGWAGTPTSWGSETKVVDGVYRINMGIQAQDPYGFGFAPKVGGTVDLIVHVYPDGVGVYGFVTSTPYPSFQVFVNGTSVFQHDQQAIGTAFIPIGSNTSSKVDVWIPSQTIMEKK